MTLVYQARFENRSVHPCTGQAHGHDGKCFIDEKSLPCLNGNDGNNIRPIKGFLCHFDCHGLNKKAMSNSKNT